jgi:hypothetical protein
MIRGVEKLTDRLPEKESINIPDAKTNFFRSAPRPVFVYEFNNNNSTINNGKKLHK